MKPTLSTSRSNNQGYALAMVVVFTALGLMALTGTLEWSTSTARLNDRNNEYFKTVAAAEGATEKVLSQMSYDQLAGGNGLNGEAYVYSRLNTYSAMVPTTSEDASWSGYQFKNAAGTVGRINVTRPATPVFTNIESKYTRKGIVATYQIISTVQSARNNVKAAVGQSIQLTTEPLFQFAIFYGIDLEINPGPTMTINGRVHSNQNVYTRPGATLTYGGDLTTSQAIYQTRKPGDGQSAGGGTITYQAAHDGGVDPINLPKLDGISADSMHDILEIPPSGEATNSAMGQLRYYNKSDMVLIISNSTVTARVNGTNIGTNVWPVFMTTNGVTNFYNKREGLAVQTTQIDVSKIRNNTTLSAMLGRPVNSIYVADMRDTDYDVVSTNYLYTTNFTYVTNTTTTTSGTMPGSGTYIGTVINTTTSSNSTTRPSSPPALNLITNTTATTTTTKPSAGTYIGNVTTNCDSVILYASAKPSVFCTIISSNGTPSSKKWSYRAIDDYSYNKITSYSYNLPAYIYDRITSINTNRTIMTNVYFTTNIVVFAQSGVRLVNAEVLPSGGLTVATPNPLYVKGDFNVSTNGTTFGSRSTTNTAHTYPASLVADAVTILSTNWSDANSALSLSSRTAKSTTINAAILAGIVPTIANSYSGGVENFPRFLENWGSATSYYNGSMVALFPSEVAVGPWSGLDTYTAPGTRQWTFDVNFLDANKLPPGSPMATCVIRAKWTLLTPGASTF